jgi:hypothetical protein
LSQTRALRDARLALVRKAITQIPPRNLRVRRASQARRVAFLYQKVVRNRVRRGARAKRSASRISALLERKAEKNHPRVVFGCPERVRGAPRYWGVHFAESEVIEAWILSLLEKLLEVGTA